MPSTRDCAAWKVLEYARIYSGNRVHKISQNMTSIRDGWRTATTSMAAAMTSCNKCGTVACESLAKQVAHAWLKANKVPEINTTPTTSTCKQLGTNEQAAYKVALYIKLYGGVDITGSAFDRAWHAALGSGAPSPIKAIIDGYPTNINAIRVGLCNGKCVSQRCEDLARQTARTWLKNNKYIASGGARGGGQPAKSNPNDPDNDCDQYGWFKGLCVVGKKLTKGAEAGVQNPLTQYLPIMLIGMGFLAVLMLAKR